METVIFEEEPISEVVYEGEFVIDERLTPKQQKRKIFTEMRKAGIEVGDESEYQIDYEGVEDNNGLSETQTTKFVVTHKYTKKVPYRISKEEVYHGVYILDGMKITPEEQRKQIFELMRDEGYSIENEDDYEIGFEGVEDNNGLSETQITHYTVSKIKKEKMNDDELANISVDTTGDIKNLYDEMVALKKDIYNTDDMDKVAELTQKINEVTNKVDNVVEQRIKNYGIFEEKIREYSMQIKELEEALQKNIKAYEDSYERIKAIMEEKTEENKEELERRKERENEKSLSIRKEIEKQKRELASLRAKRTTVKKDLETAKALEISAEEYNEIVSNLRKKDILNAILEKKGLEEILMIPAKERTMDQRRQILSAKKEIMEEIAKLQKKDEKKDVLSSIEALYGIQLQKVKRDGKQRVLIVKKSSYENIKHHVKDLPEKVIKKQDSNIDYEPGEVPKDLQEVFENQNTGDRKGLEDLYVIFHDEKDKEKLYARKPVFERFDVLPQGDEVRIEGVASYGIKREDADSIEKNKDNDVSPYQVEHRTVEVVKPEKELEELTEEDVPSKGLEDLYVIFHDEKDKEKLYARKPVFERFDVLPQGDEVRIEGVASYGIKKEDADSIEKNKDNDVSPYQVEHRTVEVVREEKELEELTEETKEEKTPSKGLEERYIIFHDEKDEDKLYARKPVFERFYLDPQGEEVRIEGVASYGIKKEDAEYIEKNAKNNYSPYIVEHRTATIEKAKKEEVQELKDIKIEDKIVKEEYPTGELKEEDLQIPEEKPKTKKEPSRGLMDRITIYREMNQSDKFYARNPVFERFNVKPIGKELRINGILCYEIASDDVKKIIENAKNDISPYKIRYMDVKTERQDKEKPTPDRVFDNITTDLCVVPEEKELQISNAQISKDFQKELKEGRTSYNIIHKVPDNIKVPVDFFDRLSEKLMQTETAKDSTKALKSKLYDLTEEEINVLLEEFRVNGFDDRFNSYTKPTIKTRLLTYGYDAIQKINDILWGEFESLAMSLKELREIEREEKDDDKTNEEILSLEEKRNDEIQEMSSHIQIIEDARKELNRLLNIHIREFEDEFKKKANSLKYTGMHQELLIDGKTQVQLENYAKNLENAIINHNDMAIVQNFLGKEGCLDESFENRGEIVGRRSLGTTYYSLIDGIVDPLKKSADLDNILKEKDPAKEEAKARVR